MSINVLSLFDGISCARVALDRCKHNIKTYYASEIDKYAIKIAQKNFPSTIHVGDVKAIDGTKFEKINLLIGGSPCQDLSIAKRNREGLQGKRSGLFFEYVRLLNEIKPDYFVLENVASMSQDAKDIITETLGVKPIMIDAALVSAQRRKRLFWTNIPNVQLPADRGILLKDVLQLDHEFYGVYSDYNNKTSMEKASTLGTGCGVNRSATFQQVITKPVRIAKIGKGGQGDRVYSIEGKSVALSANGGGRGAKTGLYAVKDFVRKLTPVECERLQSLPDNYTEGVSNTQRYKCLGNAFNVEVVAHILQNMPKS